MTTRRSLPVRVIITDSGPLISLAACGRLELLAEFQRPVVVPDVVKAECLRYPEKIGAADLAAWFAAPGCPVEVLATPLMPIWQEAVAVEEARPELHPSAGIGDAANAWILKQLQNSGPGDQSTLILTEDGPCGDGVLRDRFPEVHVLSTRAFLRTLENYGRIVSAQAVLDEIANAGRQLARYLADRPGRPTPGTKTTWAEVLQMTPIRGRRIRPR